MNQNDFPSQDPDDLDCTRMACPKRDAARAELEARAEQRRPLRGPFVGDPSEPGYRSGGNEDAKKRDAAIVAAKTTIFPPNLPEGVTQADLDAATPLPPLGDSRRPKPPVERITYIIRVTEPGYDVALFMNEDGGAEAVISRPGLKPTGVNIAPPAPGRRISIERKGDLFNVTYRDAL